MKRLFQTRSRRLALVASLVLTILVASLFCLIRRSSTFAERVEIPIYDSLTRLTWPWRAGHPDIALVTIQDPSPQSWPVSDGKLANALESILAGGATIIGVDLVRDAPVPDRMESTRSYDVVGSERLARLANQHWNIVWVRGLLGKYPFPPPDFLGENELGQEEIELRSPFADFPADADMAVRRGYASSESRLSFPAVLANAHLALTTSGNDGEDQDNRLETIGRRLEEVTSLDPNAGGYRLHGFGIPRDIGGQFLLKFTDDIDSLFPSLSLQSALARNDPHLAPNPGDSAMPVYALEDLPAMDQETLARCFKGRIVIVGTNDPRTAEDEKLIVGDRLLRGVRLHALATAQLLREVGQGEAPVAHSPEWAEDLSVIVAALLAFGCVWLLPLPTLWKSAVIPIGTAALAYLIAYFSMRNGTWFPPGAAMGSGMFSASAALAILLRAESRDRSAIYQVLEHHVGREIALKVWSSNEQLLRGDHLKPEPFEITALFSDLKGFSTVCESYYNSEKPDEFVAWLNSYLRAMVTVVHAHQGFIKQFSGDGIFVIFGFPQKESHNHALSAVRCALAMRDAVVSLNHSLLPGVPHFEARVGIYTGNVRAVSLGGSGQYDYAFLGPPVNKASRLEGIDKTAASTDPSPVRILISSPTKASIQHAPGIDLLPYAGNPVHLKIGDPSDLKNWEEIWCVSSGMEISPQVFQSEMSDP